MEKNKNLFFLLFTLLTILAAMTQIKYALNSIILSGSLKSIEFSIFQMKIYATNNNYVIGHYWIVPITLGVLYNLFIEIKRWKKK